MENRFVLPCKFLPFLVVNFCELIIILYELTAAPEDHNTSPSDNFSFTYMPVDGPWIRVDTCTSPKVARKSGFPLYGLLLRFLTAEVGRVGESAK